MYTKNTKRVPDRIVSLHQPWLRPIVRGKAGKKIEIGAKFDASVDENNLSGQGLMVSQGKMIDASFVPAPRQRNTREENKIIKDGKGDELWDDQPNKKRHKDVEARWTKKNNETVYGYKNHIKVGVKSKFIETYAATNAAVHDSQALEELLKENDKGEELYADSAYTGADQEEIIQEYGMINKVHEKAYRNRPLTEEQKQHNKEKSKKCVRAEQVFGFMEQTMNTLNVRCVGLVRATGIIGLINFTYNLLLWLGLMGNLGLRT